MPQALPLTDKLAADIGKRTELKVLTAQFGDGYAQRAANGLNPSVDVWSINWIWLGDTDRDAVRAALDAVGGHDYLTWTPYGETTQKRFIVEPDSRWESYNAGYTKIGCTLRQVF